MKDPAAPSGRAPFARSSPRLPCGAAGRGSGLLGLLVMGRAMTCGDDGRRSLTWSFDDGWRWAVTVLTGCPADCARTGKGLMRYHFTALDAPLR